jgi:hypothetical protein
MNQLIGGPLTAAAESSMFLAKTTADFINQVGFDSEQKVRNVLFKFLRTEPDPDGNMTSQEMSVDIPLLAIVPIPNLQIDEVRITFDMEVKTSDSNNNTTTANANASVRHGWAFGRVSVSGSVATNNENKRSTDNSAKYHVSVEATNHGIPEGLSRVLDMIAANVAPNIIGSTPVDRAGNQLTGSRRERNLRLRQLREFGTRLEASETAARDTFEIRLGEFLRQSDALRNRINVRLEGELSSAKDEKAREPIDAQMEANNTYWDTFRTTIRNTVLANASRPKESEQQLSAMRDDPINTSQDNEKISTLNVSFATVVEAQRDLDAATDAVAKNRIEYNDTLKNITSSEIAAANT